MIERKGKKRRWLIALAVVALLVPLSVLAARAYLHAMLDAKTVRTCFCTVTGKEYRKYNERQLSYNLETGEPIYKNPGDEEWRVYFRIDDFGAYSEETRKRLLEAENKRVSKGELRLGLPREELYERVAAGDELVTSCQLLGDDVVMTWGLREIDERFNKRR